jgi:hypothetical protein
LAIWVVESRRKEVTDFPLVPWEFGVEEITLDTVAKALGWGITDDDKENSVLNEICPTLLLAKNQPLLTERYTDTSQVLASSDGPRPGDSGGPLISFSVAGRPILRGIISCTLMDHPNIAVYANVARYQDWISAVLNENI